ncbi:hypothetical protein HME9304_02647 [Flagellimonas maritima]|uniref:Uncharacterized protein n=1 Tax=Flagellimonas maritima TaxID=1383885 RepID=A0A2Z4LV87_9FLAO|nr:hypothetical protein [Allomuricauda aurantiaca]AWX45620.1 hypothetical protein HME9304_02647 [Allomuricauda aurantiaca]
MKQLITVVVLFLMSINSYGQIERDKALHFLGGNLFGLAGAGIAKNASDGDRVWTFVGAVAGSTLIGIAKEAVDAGQRTNGWDNDDLAATILGGITVGVAIEIFSKKRNKKIRGNYANKDLKIDDLRGAIKYESSFTTNEKLPSLSSFGLSTTFLRSGFVQLKEQ